jgi:trimethylamine--corrinoid protein Co-methyltransferase
MIDMHRRFMQGLSLDDEALALHVIDQVGPDGDFISTDHTLTRFRDYWYPQLFERRRYEDWEAAGSKPLGDVLRDKTVALMESHQPERLPSNVESEIERLFKA